MSHAIERGVAASLDSVASLFGSSPVSDSVALDNISGPVVACGALG